MSALFEALRRPATPKSGELVEELHRWTRDEQLPSVFIPVLLAAVIARQQRRDGDGDSSLITARQLCEDLDALYADLLQGHRGGRPANVTEVQLSRYRTRELSRPNSPLALLILLWLSRELGNNRFEEESQIFQLLAVFNPVDAVEARVLRAEALPRFDLGTPKHPMLRSTLSRDIDRAERAVSEGLATLMGLKQISSDSLRRDFFVADQPNAHFIVYRRSIQSGLVVKGFLVIEPATTRASDAYSFNHYHITSTNDLREARGFVLTLRNTHYFLGAVGAGRRKPAVGDRGAGGRPLLSEGLKCIVINRDLSVYDNAVWSGIFLSEAPGYLPIAGRCVLVRARHDTWQRSGIDPISIHELEADLVNFAHPNLFEESSSLAKLSAAILQAIDNSYEPPLEPGGNETLAGPLTIVPLSDLTGKPSK